MFNSNVSRLGPATTALGDAFGKGMLGSDESLPEQARSRILSSGAQTNTILGGEEQRVARALLCKGPVGVLAAPIDPINKLVSAIAGAGVGGGEELRPERQEQVQQRQRILEEHLRAVGLQATGYTLHVTSCKITS